MRIFVPFLAQATSAQLLPWTLHQRCWQESPLYTPDFQSLLDGSKDHAFCSEPLSPYSTVRTNPHEPWTHRPVCTPFLPGLNNTLCVYTDASFGAGRGISIVTTPDLARQFAALPALHDQSLYKSRDINKPSDVYTTTSIPGKGIGMLSTRPLSFGTHVTRYTPAFLAYLESSLSTPDREALWRIAIAQLPLPLQESFLDLATVYGDERVRVQDIVKANTFQVMIGGTNHLAIWPETSRLNHACAPNAQYVVDTETLTHTVRVTREVGVGEEITISYTSPLEPTSNRQQHLQQGFHFTCTCRRCVDAASDARLERIKSMEAELNNWAPGSSATPGMAEDLLELYRREGLEGFMDMAYGFAALAYSAVGDKGTAVAFAEKAQEAILVKDGRWTENWGVWEEFVRDVEGHWSWKRRV
jgi:hypothetical protein